MNPHNLLQAFRATVRQRRHYPCFRFRHHHRWQTMTWEEAYEQVRDIALGLQSRGVQKGDRVAIMGKTSVEWTLCDLAILSLGAIVVPVYASNTPDQVAYLLRHAAVSHFFVEDQYLWKKMALIRKKGIDLKSVILMKGDSVKGTLSLEDLMERSANGEEVEWSKAIDSIESSDTATIVYTSGTTGNPKGAILTHGNFLAEVESMRRHMEVKVHETSLLVLPLAHIFARAIQFWQISVGYVQVYGEHLETLPRDLEVMKPHFFSAVPRIFEKIYEKIEQNIDAAPPIKKKLFDWACHVKREEGGVVSRTVADLLVFRKIRAFFGGRLRFAISGGAPLSKELGQFFSGAGVPILEGYGLTETTAGVFITSLKNPRFGTVGKPLSGVECKLASDGEILVRGPHIFEGYYRDREATQKAFERGGWFKTGDVGVFEKDGCLRITDRKKDILITAAGKNIAPQNIENKLKTIPIVSQAFVYGDRKKYLTALVTLNRDALKHEARRRGVHLNGNDLSEDPKVYQWMHQAIQSKNQKLASYETIKKFVILNHDLTQEAGELTPTLKLRRKFVSEKYGKLLEALY